MKTKQFILSFQPELVNGDMENTFSLLEKTGKKSYTHYGNIVLNKKNIKFFNEAITGFTERGFPSNFDMGDAHIKFKHLK